METSSTIIGLIILISFLIPFLFMQLKSGKKKAKLKEYCDKYNLAYAKLEEFNGRYILLDEPAGLLAFATTIAKEIEFKQFELKQLKSCELIGSVDSCLIGLRLQLKDDAAVNLYFTDKSDGIHILNDAHTYVVNMQNKISAVIR